MSRVKIDQQVPDFVGQATGNKDVLLSKLKGWNVVLYFYPKDDTPGCTTEGQDFSEFYQDFKDTKTLIFGVSRDSLESHESFKDKYNLKFPLIADSDAYLCELFNVIKPLNMYGKQIMGVERSTFLIDKNGVLQKEWRKVRVNGHVDQVLDAVEALK
jgi:peroxiredoxin Q/BCP